MTWRPGDVVEYRDLKHGVPWSRTPARVIEDDAMCVVLWWPPGTVYQGCHHGTRAESLEAIASGAWKLADAEWWGGDALLIIPTDAPYAIWPYRTADGDHIGWYCNLQEPLTRTDIGFDTSDWILDVVASPDLSGWMWKDEDELLEVRRLGLYSDTHVDRIRAAGTEVIELIEHRDPVFDTWASWRASDDWPVPVLR
jgi:hypothetical protein